MSLPFFPTADLVCNSDDFQTLCTLLARYGLNETLAEGTFTLFAPTDDAFTPEVLDLINEQTDQKATEVLLFHTVSGSKLASTDLECNAFLTMTNEKQSRTLCNGDDEPTFQVGPDNTPLNFPAFVEVDIPAFNGIIHSVSEVLLFEGFFTEEPSAAPSMMPSQCSSVSK